MVKKGVNGNVIELSTLPSNDANVMCTKKGPVTPVGVKANRRRFFFNGILGFLAEETQPMSKVNQSHHTNSDNNDSKNIIRLKCRRMVERLEAIRESEEGINLFLLLEISRLIYEFESCEKVIAEVGNDPDSLRKAVFRVTRLLTEAYIISIALSP